MSIATKTGDAGTTVMMFGRRVSKCDPRVEAYGTVDELNAALGLARALGSSTKWLRDSLLAIQGDLVVLMGELATRPDDLERFDQSGFRRVTGESTKRLEVCLHSFEEAGMSFEGWATPGANPASAALDVARTVCRRAERKVCALHDAGQLGNPDIIVFLNRLSDLLWLMARRAESG
jgi:cob(I)alamin adenosyltransferase